MILILSRLKSKPSLFYFTNSDNNLIKDFYSNIITLNHFCFLEKHSAFISLYYQLYHFFEEGQNNKKNLSFFHKSSTIHVPNYQQFFLVFFLKINLIVFCHFFRNFMMNQNFNVTFAFD